MNSRKKKPVRNKKHLNFRVCIHCSGVGYFSTRILEKIGRFPQYEKQNCDYCNDKGYQRCVRCGGYILFADTDYCKNCYWNYLTENGDLILASGGV